MDDDYDWQRQGGDDEQWDSASDHGEELSDSKDAADGFAQLQKASEIDDADESTDADIDLLKEKLADIPQSLHQDGFNALKEILDFLETEDLQPNNLKGGGGEQAISAAHKLISHVPERLLVTTGSDSDGEHGEEGENPTSGSDSDAEVEGGFKQQSIEGWLETLCTYIDEDWETVIDNHFTGFNYCITSFSHVVKPKVGDTLVELKSLKQKLDKAKLYAGSRTTDLKDKHLKRIQHTEILRILDRVEELSGVIPQLDGMLRRRSFLEYVHRLNWALKTIMGEDMANIGALGTSCDEFFI